MSKEKRVLGKRLIGQITKLLHPKYVKEAIEIFEICDEKWIDDFKKHYKLKSGNVCCLIFDFAKYDMVKKGIVKQRKKDQWGRHMDMYE